MRPFVWVLLGLVALSACRDTDRDGTRDGRDCLPENPAAFRGGIEVCDGIDNDCDGQVDEDVAIVAYWDRDRDGFGDPAFVRRVCSLPPDGSLVAGDCDDSDTLTNPDAVEICDLLDNDCDNEIDEDVLRDFYVDADGDGHGSATKTVQACFAGPGRALLPDDCDDTDPEAWSDRPEICDGIDNDCDGDTDEDVDDQRFWADADGDGYGDPASLVLACGPGPGVVDNDWDCDDADANHSPASKELRGNSTDEDCDGFIDELGVGDAASNEFTTFDDALAVVGTDEVIQFDEGTHFVNLDLRTENLVTTEFTLAGEGCGRTTLVGLAADSVLRMDKGTLTNMTVSGGTGHFFPATEESRGGGLAVSGDMAVEQVCFEQNSAGSHGGGVAVGNGAELRLADSIVANNASGALGGGIWVEAEATLRASRVQVLSNNASLDAGGGIGVSGGTAILNHVVVADNFCFAEVGCGVQVQNDDDASADGLATVHQVTFHANRTNRSVAANPRGLALGVRASDVAVTRSLFTGHEGTPIFVYQQTKTSLRECEGCDVTIRNSGFRENTSADLKEHTNRESWVVGRYTGEPAYTSVDPDRPSRTWDLRLRSASDFLAVTDGGAPFELGAFGGLSAGIAEGTLFAESAAARTTDSDIDGIVDADELFAGTAVWLHDAADDPDADGLDNLAEHAAGTDPFAPDTDLDGVSDADEISATTDPLDPRTHRPTADAGSDGVAWVGTEVTSSAEGSFDPQGSALTYQWSLLSVPGISIATLTTATGPIAEFTPDEPGSYELEVEVSNGLVTHTDCVTVRAFEGVLVPDDASSVEAAVALAGAGDAIGLREGTWSGSIATEGTDLAVVGLGRADQVVLRGNAQHSVVSAVGGTVLLANLTVSNGHGAPHGGGLAVADADRVELHGVRFVGNTAQLDGGGLWVRQTTTEITDTTFLGNLAGRNGGGAWLQGSVLRDFASAQRVTLAHNEARDGGGLYFFNDTQNSVDANLTLDAFVCQENAAERGACVFHRGSRNTGVFATNGVVVGHDATATSLFYTLRGRTVVRSTIQAFSPGTDGWLFDGLTVSDHEHFAGLRYSNPGRDPFSPTATEDLARDEFVTAAPDFALFTVGADPGSDQLASMAAATTDAGFTDDLDPDGSRADVGPCGGPHAAASCARFRTDIDADGLVDGWEALLGLPSTVHPSDDPDADGLDNAAEQAAGTDPRVADTDHDGVSDSAELGTTDPTNATDHRPRASVTYTTDASTGFVQLDGSASSDPNGDLLTYAWTVLDVPEGSLVTTGGLLQADTDQPSFFADVRGYYRVQLVVSDGVASSRPVAPAVVRGQVLRVVASPAGPLEYGTLQEAVDASQFGDEIEVGAGTFPATVAWTDHRVVIRGQGIGTTVLQGSDEGSSLSFVGGALSLRDVTVTGGGAEEGGAVACDGGELHLERVRVAESLAIKGGAISMNGCDASVQDSEFQHNYAGMRAPTPLGLGGAIRAAGGTLEVLRTRFDGNASSVHGGAINLAGTAATIRHSVFTRNDAFANGGAVNVVASPSGRPPAAVLIDHCTFVGNQSELGVIHVGAGFPESAEIRNSILVESSLYGVWVPDLPGVSVHHNGFFRNDDHTLPLDLVTRFGTANVWLEAPQFASWDPLLPELDDLRLLYTSGMLDRADDQDLGGGPGDLGAFGGLDAPADSDLYVRDTDGDGMTDVWESAHGFDPGVADGAGDRDADGLSNAAEHDAGADPNVADTDGDGISDGADVSPLVPAGQPTAELEEARVTRNLGTTAVLQAEGTDPNGDAMTATWQLVGMPGRSTLTNSDLNYTPANNPSVVTFTPDTPGTYLLEVTFHDGAVSSAPALATMRIRGDVLVPEDYASVAAALEGVVEGSTVQVASGTWPLSYDSGPVGVAIQGAGRGQTVLDAEGRGPVLAIEGVNQLYPVVELRDLTLTGGLGLTGGALDVRQSAKLTLAGVEVSGNDAVEGGGVACASCDEMVVEDCVFTENWALYNGGAFIMFTDPTTSDTLTVSRTLFAGNEAILGYGGAVFAEGELSGTFTNVVFADNLADRGGALAINAPSIGNGGVFTLDHVTATANQAVSQGSFLEVIGRAADVTLQNSIVWEHQGAEAVSESRSPNAFLQRYTLFADNDGGNYSLPTLGSPVDAVDGNIIDSGAPAFTDVTPGDWTTADWSLTSTSDALDMGTGSNDVDGSPPDMGAFGGPGGDWIP